MKVAVLCGGRSFERQVSLRSGASVVQALRELGHDPVLVDAGPATARELQGGGFDCAFVALHGTGGEDGHVQGLLELLGIPYTGSRPGPSQLAHEKARAKRLLRAAGVSTPDFVSLTQVALQEFGAGDALAEAGESLGFPVIVKPATGGSAMGVRIALTAADLPRALVHALSYDDHVVVERFVDGRELAVCVLGTEQPRALPPIRIIPRRADHYDFESRYTHGETEFACPPTDLSERELAACTDAALRSCAALDLSGCARVDIILDDDGVPWVLEINSVPGMTDTSLLPMAARAAGLSLANVVGELVDDAMAQGVVAADGVDPQDGT